MNSKFKCPVCGSDKYVERDLTKYFNMTIMFGIKVALCECKGCSVLFRHPDKFRKQVKKNGNKGKEENDKKGGRDSR